MYQYLVYKLYNLTIIYCMVTGRMARWGLALARRSCWTSLTLFFVQFVLPCFGSREGFFIRHSLKRSGTNKKNWNEFLDFL